MSSKTTPRRGQKGPKLPETSSSTFIVLKVHNHKVVLEQLGPTDVQKDEEQCRAANAKVAPEFTVVAPVESEMETRHAWGHNLANHNRVPKSPGTLSRQAAATNRHASGSLVGAKPSIALDAKTTSRRRQRTPSRKAKQELADQLGLDVVLPYGDSIGKGVVDETNKENEMADRPKLKLKLGSVSGASSSIPSTPNPQSVQRTPSIKLSFSGVRPGGDATVKVEDANGEAPGSSAKKRKRESKSAHDRHPAARPPTQVRKLTFVNQKSAQTPVAPMIKLKSKGKIPKRPLGVGYDSELEEREIDPVILEGFILRMQPGPDCDYLRDAIKNGTMGLARHQGGADVRMRVLDTQGRRGLLMVRSNQYATTLVDLPCIIEGMKSWDKKGFIKSIDICQMMLVLGPCKNDEEARHYPLPEDVNPHSYQYAHGLTAPMKWVRKRRFARTKRARVDDIEAIERRVNALLEADKLAHSSAFEVFDHDPRNDEPQYSPDEDAEGEDDDEAEDYFDGRNGQDIVETPYAATPEEDIDQEDVDEFERMFGTDDPAPGHTAHPTTLHPPEGGDSSFPVTSTSVSPSATAAQTPASGVDATSDDDDDDDDEDRDDEEKDDDENLQQIKGRIQDVEDKIREQTDLLKKTQNSILRRKIAKKIEELRDDVKMMKMTAGLAPDADDDEE